MVISTNEQLSFAIFLYDEDGRRPTEDYQTGFDAGDGCRSFTNKTVAKQRIFRIDGQNNIV